MLLKKNKQTAVLHLEEVDTLDEVETEDEVDNELDVEILKLKRCTVLPNVIWSIHCVMHIDIVKF